MIQPDVTAVAQQTSDEIKGLLRRILTVVGHVGDQLEAETSQLFNSITQLAVGVLATAQAEKDAAVVTKLKAATSLDAAVAALGDDVTPELVSSALVVASQQVFGFYFQKVGPELSAEQRQEIADIVMEYQQGAA